MLGQERMGPSGRTARWASAWIIAMGVFAPPALATIGDVVAPAPRPGQPGDEGDGPLAALTTPPPLSTVPVPLPDDLDLFVQDFGAAVALGKALFWDVRTGSDGMTACASCHFQAGADVRTISNLSPGGDGLFEATASGAGGPNYTVGTGDFPFLRRLDPDQVASDLLFQVHDVMGSSGVPLRAFDAVTPGQPVDGGRVVPDPTFQVGGINTMRVTGRNTPSVINAVFLNRIFWDGRANQVFNGLNPWGDLDPVATVLTTDATGALVPERILLNHAALASQAVGPPLNETEMSWMGRTFPELGRKMLSMVPLERQHVHPQDDVLGPLSNFPGKGLLPGITYASMIQDAFVARWWNGTGSVGGATHMESNFSLYWGLAILCYESTLVSDQTPYDLWAAGDTTALTQQEKDGLFVLVDSGCTGCHEGSEFAGAAESVLFLDPVVPELLDRMLMSESEAFGELNLTTAPGDPFAEPLGADPRGGFLEIVGDIGLVAYGMVPGVAGQCGPSAVTVVLEIGPAVPDNVPGVALFFLPELQLLTGDAVHPEGLCDLEMTVSILSGFPAFGGFPHVPAGDYDVRIDGQSVGTLPLTQQNLTSVYDAGFYNIGSTPTADDPGVGGDGPFGPLSLTKRIQQGDNHADIPFGANTNPPVIPSDFAAVHGALKAPSLRNLHLTGPYMHHGGLATLEQVVQFYTRGADFAAGNPDLAPDVRGLPLLHHNPEDQAALVAFLRNGLLDPRVLHESGVFSHPSLPLKVGHVGDETSVAATAAGEAVYAIKVLSETGAAGGPALSSFADGLAPSVQVLAPSLSEAWEGFAGDIGSTLAINLVLGKAPTADVSIDLSLAQAAQASVSPATLVFTPDDWFSPHEARITAIQDFVADGDVLVQVTTSPAMSMDLAFAGLPVDDVDVWIRDMTPQPGWVSLSGGLAGVQGVPLLTGQGTLLAGDPVTLSLSGARQDSTATLVVGLSQAQVPFQGGLLVPTPDILIPNLGLDASGALAFGGSWPVGVPPAFTFFFQFWVVDPAATAGLAGSNGLAGTAP